MSQNPPPPIPEEYGSTTPRAAVTAMAASKALPPSRNTSIPACVASGWALAMAAWPGISATPAETGASAKRRMTPMHRMPKILCH